MRRLLAVFLCLVITLCCLPCLALAAEPAGPLGESPAPTLLDTGRGYVVYYWYNSAVYYSPDGTDWADLSDRAWVKDAAPYTYLGVGHLGHREFELCWTGTEYMLRQSLLDDPRSVYRRLGDSPRNSVVTFLDEDFQVIGELAFDGPVTAIRHQDGTYYATVAGTETAFTREDWAEEDTGFPDVEADDWFAPYVAVCVEEGLMKGTGEGYFSPERTLTGRECSVLALRLYDIMGGGTGDFEPAPEDFGQISITLEDGTTLSGGMGDGCIVQGLPLADKAWTWEYVDIPRLVYHKYLALDISTPEELAWLERVNAHRVMDRAVASYGGVEYPGVMHFFSHTGTKGVFFFYPDDYDAFTEATKVDRVFSTDPGAWYRDAWYYAYTHHTEDDTDANYYLMEDLVRDNAATRWDFASRLARVAGELPAINDIQTIPVESWQQETLLPLYNGGILTGIDQYGTFYPEGTLTRAEAAAMLARILRPELRISFAPLPYREGLPVPAALYGRAYRLTYVGELPQEEPAAEETEYRAHLGDDLLADGTYLAFSYSWDDPAYDGPTRYYFYTEKGNGWVDPETGQEFSFPEGEAPWNYTHFKNGYLNGYDRYYGLDLTPVTQRFEFVRDIDLNGQGYVNWKGGLYRIEFQ